MHLFKLAYELSFNFTYKMAIFSNASTLFVFILSGMIILINPITNYISCSQPDYWPFSSRDKLIANTIYIARTKYAWHIICSTNIHVQIFMHSNNYPRVHCYAFYQILYKLICVTEKSNFLQLCSENFVCLKG